jgi:uncharacterized protein YutE (UPF0331/DUF86 family)
VSPGKLNKRVIGDRLAWLDKMVAEIRALPLEGFEEFSSTRKNVWAAESCLRRALESIFDLGRHILARGFGIGVTEYKQIATELEKAGVLSPSQARLLRTLAGYRNRMVHFYCNTVSIFMSFLFRLDMMSVINAVPREYRKIWPHNKSNLLSSFLKLSTIDTIHETTAN